MIEQTLQSLGLNEKEISLYLSLLSLGSVPASVLAKRTHIPRSTAQYICGQLTHKGLLTMTKKGNTFLYTIESPEKLFYLLERQKEKIMEQEQQLHRIMGELKNRMNPSAILPKVQFYEGTDGVRSLALKAAKEKGDVHTYSARDYFLQKNPRLVEEYYKKITETKERKFYTIREKRAAKYSEPDNRLEKYFRSIDQNKVHIQLINDTMFIFCIEEQSPIGISIKHKIITDSFRELFMELWESL